MAHDQEKFYEAEEQLDQAEAQPMNDHEDVNDMVYFIELLKHLRATVERANRIPMSNLGVINVTTCMQIIDQLDQNLPDAIQYGMQMYSEKSRIMGEAESTAISRVTSAEMKAKMALENARREADQIVMDAEDEAQGIMDDAMERAKMMVSESEIVRQARDEALSIRSEARVEAKELRLKANHDVHRLMNEVENHLSETLREMRELHSDINDQE